MIISIKGMAGRGTRGRNAYIPVWKACMKERSLGRPRRRWEDNIEINLIEMWLEGLYWILFMLGIDGGPL
jgi:hypothetical protein